MIERSGLKYECAILNIIFIIALSFLFGCVHSMEKMDYVQGEILVKFKESVSDQRADEIIKEQGAVIIRYIDKIKVYHLRLREGQSVTDAVRSFSSYPEVEYAEPNYIRRIE